MSSGVVQELAGQVPGEAGSPGPGGRDQGPGGRGQPWGSKGWILSFQGPSLVGREGACGAGASPACPAVWVPHSPPLIYTFMY